MLYKKIFLIVIVNLKIIEIKASMCFYFHNFQLKCLLSQRISDRGPYASKSDSWYNRIKKLYDTFSKPFILII